jgi:tRNA dimethylallyltransferase
MDKKIVILGPTGVGKTRIACDLAEKLNAEIVSADSMQVYRLMDIGTGKPDAFELARVPHHLVGCIDPGESFHVAAYVREANRALRDIARRGKRAIITGGTGMYLRALLKGILPETRDDRPVRRRLEAELERNGIAPLLEELNRVDPAKAGELTPNDHRRIIRALSYYRVTGRPLSSMQTEWNKPAPDDFLLLGIRLERSLLYRTIEARVDSMIEKGFVEEVRGLVSLNLPPDASSRQAIGYRELAEYLEGGISLENAVQRIKQNTRRYAKRQLTWFRKVDNIHWFDAHTESRPVETILAFLLQQGSAFA